MQEGEMSPVGQMATLAALSLGLGLALFFTQG